jgi:hypothetical protein
MTEMDAEDAKALIMKAREHWFAAEAAAQENAARASAEAAAAQATTAPADAAQETTTQG